MRPITSPIPRADEQMGRIAFSGSLFAARLRVVCVWFVLLGPCCVRLNPDCGPVGFEAGVPGCCWAALRYPGVRLRPGSAWFVCGSFCLGRVVYGLIQSAARLGLKPGCRGAVGPHCVPREFVCGPRDAKPRVRARRWAAFERNPKRMRPTPRAKSQEPRKEASDGCECRVRRHRWRWRQCRRR